jgi:hypothetical protein
MEKFTAFELKGVPTETFHKPLDVVDGSGCVGNIPQQHTGQKQGEIQNKMEDQSHPKDAPRVNMAQDSRRSPHRGSFKGHTSSN